MALEKQYLCYIYKPQSKTECILSEDIHSFQSTWEGYPYRISPIFSVSPNEIEKPSSSSFNILFVSSRNSFSLSGAFPDSFKKYAWFTLGCYSLVFCYPDTFDGNNFLNFIGHDLISSELWKVENKNAHLINFNQPKVCRIKDPSIFNIRIPEHTTVDVSRELVQIQSNSHNLVSQGRHYFPEIEEIIRRVTITINGVVSEISSYYKKIREAKDDENTIALYKKLNHRFDQLTQVNAALPYLISQLTFGSFLEKNTPLIGDHNLLGTGTAIVSLFKITEYIERSLELHQVLSVVSEVFPKENYVDPNDVNLLKNLSGIVDKHTDKCKAKLMKPKMVYISGRLGFAETRFNTTTPPQVLHASDSLRWNLITITHELLHAHATGLLSSIFGATKKNANIPFEDQFIQVYNNYIENVGRNTRNQTSLINTLQESVHTFCDEYLSLKNYISSNRAKGLCEQDEHSIKISSDSSQPDRTFRKAYKLLNEIIVHVLDRFYFYGGQRDEYVESIWCAWNAVPRVAIDIKHYLLRTLIAIGWDLETSKKASFKKCVGITVDRLSRLHRKYPDDGFWGSVLEELNDKETIRELFIYYTCGMKISRVVGHLVTSSNLQDLFEANDPNFVYDSKTETTIYNFPFAQFTGGKINNPIAFLKNRLKELGVFEEAGNYSEDYRSAWLIFACSSSQCKIER